MSVVAEPDRSGGIRGFIRSRVPDVIACALLLIVTMAFVIVNVQRHSSVSPIDEYVYIDYVAKVPSQLVVHRGEETGEYAREYLACHGVRAIGQYPPSLCANGSELDAEFPNGGLTSADLYTPLYPAITWAIAQPAVAIGAELVTGARLAGIFWLGATAMLLFVALRRLLAPTLLAFGTTLAVIVSPPSEWATTYVSTDASVMLAGSLMLFLLATPFRSARRRRILFMIAAAVVVWLKVQNIIVVGFAALVLLMLAAVRTARRARRGSAGWTSFFKDPDVVLAALTAGAAVVAQLLWLGVRSAIAVGEFPDQGVSTDLTGTLLLSELLKFLPNVLAFPVPLTPHPLYSAVAFVGSLIAAVGAIGLAIGARGGSRREVFGIATLVVGIATGPVLILMSILGSGFYFVLPVRYGLVLVPLCFTAVALLIGRKRWPAVAITVFGIGALAANFVFGTTG